MKKTVSTTGQRATKETICALLSVSNSRHLNINAIVKAAIGFANSVNIQTKKNENKQKDNSLEEMLDQSSSIIKQETEFENEDLGQQNLFPVQVYSHEIKAYSVQFNLGCQSIYLRFEVINPSTNLEKFKKIIMAVQYLLDAPYPSMKFFIEVVTDEFMKNGFARVQK